MSDLQIYIVISLLAIVAFSHIYNFFSFRPSKNKLHKRMDQQDLRMIQLEKSWDNQFTQFLKKMNTILSNYIEMADRYDNDYGGK